MHFPQGQYIDGEYKLQDASMTKDLIMDKEKLEKL